MEFYNENNEEKDKTNEEEINENTNEQIQKEISEEEKQEQTEANSKKKDIEQTAESEDVKENKKTKIVLISVISILALLLLAIICTGFALLNINNTRIMNGISINGIKINGLTKEEAEKKITEKMEENLNKDIHVKAEDFEYFIKLSQIEVDYNIAKAVQEAYNIGRNKNIFSNNFSILKAMITGTDINLDFTYNEELLNNIVSDIAVKVPNAIIDTDYYIENDKLTITKGKAGNSIDKEKAKNAIIDVIINNDKNEIQVDIIYEEPNKIDIDKIYNEIYTEPKDAYYTKEPFEVFPHVNGVDFDLEAARELLKEDKDEYEIMLTITEPTKTTNKIGTEAFPDLLSTFSTKYDASNTGRSKNLQLAAEKINGTVVMPGEVFSYNKTVGERTIAKGYTEASGYAGGKVVPTLGGGICQISSTLYDAVVYANLEIIERKSHMFLASYVGAGKDATVVYGSIDFKFKNTRNYPIVLKTAVKNGIAKIEVYGIKEEVEYEVEISTKILSYIPFSVKYETDSSLIEGKEKVVQNGMNGVKSITYKILKLNGQQVSSTVLSTDTYDPMNKIIKKGVTETTTTTSTEPINTIPEESNEDKEKEENTTEEIKPSTEENTSIDSENNLIAESSNTNSDDNNV